MPRVSRRTSPDGKVRGLIRPRIAALLLIVCALGCRKRQRELAPGVSDSTYVAVIAQLEQVQRDSLADDSTRRTARQNTFTRYKVSPEAIEEASATLASDPQRALKLWQAIDRRYKASTPPTPRTATPAPLVSDMPIPPRPAPKQPPPTTSKQPRSTAGNPQHTTTANSQRSSAARPSVTPSAPQRFPNASPPKAATPKTSTPKAAPAESAKTPTP